MLAVDLGLGYEAILADASSYVRIIRPDGSICQVCQAMTPIVELHQIVQNDWQQLCQTHLRPNP